MAYGEYLVITDKYSGWPEIYDFTRGASTEDTVLRLLARSTTITAPKRLTSDNRPSSRVRNSRSTASTARAEVSSTTL